MVDFQRRLSIALPERQSASPPRDQRPQATRQEAKRHTRLATIFSNETLLLRRASGAISEMSDDWESERA
jgi:hypothetical protein